MSKYSFILLGPSQLLYSGLLNSVLFISGHFSGLSIYVVGSELNQSTRKVCKILDLAIMQDFIEYYEAKTAANVKMNLLS